MFTRLSAQLTVVPALIFALIMALSGWQTVRGLRAELINQINDDAASLSEIYLSEGPDGVDVAIAQRLDLSPLNRAGAHYRFETPDGIIRAGDLGKSASDAASLTEPLQFDDADQGTVTLRATVFRNGETLVVARENTALRKAVRVLIRNAVLGLLALIALSSFMAMRATGGLRRRVAAMNATLDHVGKGHLDARLSGMEATDEIGELTGHINAMISRAERLLTLRKRVTDQVAHEMRSPLTRLDAALAGAQSDAAVDPALLKARSELTSSLRLLDGLLDVSSADAQQGDRRGFERVDLGGIVRDVSELFEPVAELRDQVITLDIAGDVRIDAAPSQIGRLVSNLLDNAVKYADPSSIVAVSVSVSVGRDAHHAVMSVTNTGPPIEGSLRDEIFTPFFRHPDMANTQGHGLGLALCRAIAARHEGTLAVTPDTKRTIFTLTLPLAAD